MISVCGLHKSYGSIEALAGIDLEVQRGEIFALLGPNGAGKTTTIEILEGFRTRDSGTVTVLGNDPANTTRQWRARIGIVLQTCQLEPELTVRESLELFAGYAEAPLSLDEVLGLVGLEDVQRRRAGKLSGGQQRRLDVGLGLIGNPELLFLDEPTTGFDPAARHQFWDMIRRQRQLGRTVLLTTHYMDEAQALADRVAIISRGKVVALGAPDELGGRDRSPASITIYQLVSRQATCRTILRVKSRSKKIVSKSILPHFYILSTHWLAGRSSVSLICPTLPSPDQAWKRSTSS